MKTRDGILTDIRIELFNQGIKKKDRAQAMAAICDKLNPYGKEATFSLNRVRVVYDEEGDMKCHVSLDIRALPVFRVDLLV